MNHLPRLEPKSEIALSKAFIQTILRDTSHENVIIGVSGGIDSATSLYLLDRAIPKEHIYAVHLYYFEETISGFRKTIDPLGLPQNNILLFSIEESVDMLVSCLEAQNDSVRKGNIMARVRMIHLFDLAKKYKALVCGTENRSEYHLGYFTRYGDAASDFEIINHLYKTQVRELAAHLDVPKGIIDAVPSAGLTENQTDEKDFGFTYKEADEVLHLHFDRGKSIEEIETLGFMNASKIIARAVQNSFKHNVPYVMG